jgi:hypothetical protein
MDKLRLLPSTRACLRPPLPVTAEPAGSTTGGVRASARGQGNRAASWQPSRTQGAVDHLQSLKRTQKKLQNHTLQLIFTVSLSSSLPIVIDLAVYAL